MCNCEYYDFFKNVVLCCDQTCKLRLSLVNYKLAVNYIFFSNANNRFEKEDLFYTLLNDYIDVNFKEINTSNKYKVIIDNINDCNERTKEIFFSTLSKIDTSTKKSFISYLFTRKAFFTKESWKTFIKSLHDKNFRFYDDEKDIDLIIELNNLGFDVASRVKEIKRFYPQVNILYKEGILTKAHIIQALKEINYYRWNTTKEEEENLIKLGVFTSKEYMELKKAITSNY